MCVVAENKVEFCGITACDVKNMELREKFNDAWYEDYERRYMKRIGVEFYTKTNLSRLGMGYRREVDALTRQACHLE